MEYWDAGSSDSLIHSVFCISILYNIPTFHHSIIPPKFLPKTGDYS